jgi:hypothetical protein
VALDCELHREVALKQILDHHADDLVRRQRFLIEAEITDGLEHPRIVPGLGRRVAKEDRNQENTLSLPDSLALCRRVPSQARR